MESELTCAVCSDVYLEGKREPVTLPECGHTFCRQCLLNLERSGNLSCPYCRTKHQGQPMSQMATVYALLSLTKFFRRSKFGVCETHSSNLDFWCETCILGLCGFCLHESHSKRDHDVAIMKDAMESKKSEIRKAGIHFLDDINKEKIFLMKEIHDSLLKVSDLCERAESLTSSVKNIKEVMVDAGESFSMDLVISLLEKMKSFRPLATEERIDGDDAGGSGIEVSSYQEGSPLDASLVSENRSPRSRCDSAEDSLQHCDARTNSSFLSSLEDNCLFSASGSDTEEERFSPSENGAAACASRTVLLTECPTFTTRHRLFNRYRTEREFHQCDSPSVTPSVTLTMLQRDYSVIVPAASSTSDDNPIDLSSGQVIVGTAATILNRNGNQYSDILRPRQNDTVALGESADVTTSAGWLAWSARGDDGREGRFRWEDGRLHLYTLAEKMQEVHGTIKLPVIVSLLPNSPEVFLDLGVDGVPFGRVYIKLWGELRRAQHFLALCVGYLGPSYRGSRCSKVEGKDKPGECLRVNHYITENGIATARGLMDGLEWSGEYSAIKREGLVVAASGGRNEYDGCFDICTRGNPAKKFSCPFGEVVSGMAVVKEATHHDPIGDLIIMNTGVVVIDRTT